MPKFLTYNVVPKLPPALEPLREIVFNVWWTWEPSARRLFRHLDPELWDRTNHNPVRMLQLSRQRSEEHTSELQSRQYLVCRLLLEKKKNTIYCDTSIV